MDKALLNSAKLIRFGIFEADLQSGELRKNGRKIHIQDLPFRLLAVLLEHPGEVIPRDRLREILWPPDTFVEFEHSLNTAVVKLRTALGDSADSPRFIETIPRRGYRFLADVQPSGQVHASSDTAMHGSRRTVSAAGAFVLVAVVGLGTWFGLLRRPTGYYVPRVSVFAGLPGLQTGPALSADGNQIAFVWNGERLEDCDIYVQLVGDATPRRLTTNSANEFSPVWSPDSLRIAFLRSAPTGTEVIISPAVGGTEQRLHVLAASCQAALPHLARRYCGLAWSPDGKFLSIVDRESPQ